MPRMHVRSMALAVSATLVAALLAGASAGTAGAAKGPKHGGSITYAIEAETTGGYCLPGNAQLAAGGIQVVTAIYDTLVTINDKSQYVPYLAKSVTPNATYDQWTITLRPGIKFQDGEALDANAVKLNLDTYRGVNPKVKGPLSPFVWKPVDSVTVTDPLTVVVKTKTPWVAFPALLFGTGRTGIVAPAQLASQDVCPTKMIGTGPFKLVEWRQNESLTVERNPNYWRPGLPYLDRIKFVPVADSASELNGLEAGQFDVIQTSAAKSILALRDRARTGSANELDTDRGAEVGYGLLNLNKAPFNDITARQAVAYAGDPNQLNQIRNKGLETLASGPFGPGTPEYVPHKSSLLPKHNIAKARALAAQWSAAHGGQKLSYEYLTGTDPELLALAELVKQQDSLAGIDVTIQQVDQSTQINRALSGDFQLQAFRNHPQGDPDTQYVWWHSGSPVNFSGIKDPVIDQTLDQGRVETDPAKRIALYKQLNKQFATQLYEFWTWYQRWGVGAQKNISGLTGPALPNGGKPFALYAGIIPTVGLSKS